MGPLKVLRGLSRLLSRGWNESVIRRAMTLLVITVPATLLNLALTYSASHMLNPTEFGIFYTAITTINILFAPAIVLNLFFSRYVATIFARGGLEAANGAFVVILKTLARWLALASVIGVLAVIIVGALAGKFSATLGIVIIVIVATSYFAECGRVILQGEHRFTRLGIYTLAWMVLRFVLGLGGLWAFGTVWGGLAGVALSAPAAFVLFFGINPLASRVMGELPDPPKLTEMVPFALGYALFSAAAHADIIVAYVALDPVHLGIYSASSVLPKGLLMATLPIIQLAFPLMVGRQVEARPGLGVILKGIALTGAVSVAGAAGIFLVSGPACSSSYGLAGCDPTTMIYGALAMISFGLLRFFVSIDYSVKRDWVPSLLAVPTVIFPAVIIGMPLTPETLALYFLIFSVATLLPYLLLSLFQPRREHVRPTP
jgi:O-antigen/teichoic acid export membrane protein